MNTTICPQTIEHTSYQLFPPNQPSLLCDIVQKKTTQVSLSEIIESYFEKNKDADSYLLTKYTNFEIDGIQAKILIFKDSDNTYSYRIISKNIEYDDSEEDNNYDFELLYKENFANVLFVLEHIKTVENTYKFLDYYLLSPEEIFEAKLQREFFPLSQDTLCSVCYEKTMEITTCKHRICLKCRETCIVKGNEMCPICRVSKLRYYPSDT